MYEFLVSKETVVLHWWERSKQKFVVYTVILVYAATFNSVNPINPTCLTKSSMCVYMLVMEF